MKNIALSTEKIKEAIPHGGLKEIAKLSNCSVFTVSRVVNGKSKNQKVTDTITIYLKNLNLKNKDLANTVASLQNTL